MRLAVRSVLTFSPRVRLLLYLNEEDWRLLTVFGLGWDKTYSLRHIEGEGFEEIHFFGDKASYLPPQSCNSHTFILTYRV